MRKGLCRVSFGAMALLSTATAGQEPHPALCGHARATASDDPVDLVNPLMGTDSTYALSYGNTYPSISLPWGMNAWTPMTANDGDGWAYRYRDTRLTGFKQTHQPSPWMNDYGAFALMPGVGALKVKDSERASWFSHKAEIATPYYYRAYVADADTRVEITPTGRAALFRFTFPESGESHILVDAFDKGSSVTILPEQRRIIGYASNNHGGVPANFRNYFVIQFDHGFDMTATWGDGWAVKPGTRAATGDHVGAVVGFRTRKGEVLEARIASSFISPEQAALNLDREIGSRDFATLCQSGRDRWNASLGRYRVEDPDLDARRTFYSALYRTQLFPRPLDEIDAAGRTVHYSPYDGVVHPAISTPTTAFGTRSVRSFRYTRSWSGAWTPRSWRGWSTPIASPAGCPNGQAPATAT